ncbi:MAG: GTPase Era [Oligoflexia bacterium]|nr:GTPase Era [Oligoflexia bacterium]MBF0366244.1 GTPase Era [Oligoflexia bacterium]
MLICDQHPDNRSITVGVLGEPNVGKSSLINYLLGHDLSAVTAKAQTTRNQFHCVYHIDRVEVILVDTPGLHNSAQELNRRMNQESLDAPTRTDINLLIIDATKNIGHQLAIFADKFNLVTIPQGLSIDQRTWLRSQLKSEREDLRSIVTANLWVVFNKSDLVGMEGMKEVFTQEVAAFFPGKVEKFFFVSALTGDGVHELTSEIYDRAPSAAHTYPDGSMSNKNERFFVCEYIREQAFMLLHEEVPYELAVVIDRFEDFRDEKDAKIAVHIDATIVVNRPSQRGIVVGKGGAVIKDIGTKARTRIESLLGGKVYLNLHVKVIPRWFRNNNVLEQVGLRRAKDSIRVWRKREGGQVEHVRHV